MPSKKILIVDDDRSTLRLLEQTLASEGYQTVLASTGQQAIADAQKELPDLMVVDIVLPDIDGSEVARSLREISSTRDIPLLFISGIVTAADEPGRDTQVKAGGLFYEVIAKPFAHDQLLRKVHKMLA